MIDNAQVNETKPGLIASVCVKYRFMDGYHVFTSPDVRGLYVASKDAEKAFERVAPILADLAEAKLGRQFRVEATVGFEEFLDATAGARILARPSNRPIAVRDRSYVIREMPQREREVA